MGVVVSPIISPKGIFTLCLSPSSSLPASSTGFSYFFLARLGDWERAIRRERQLVAIEERECRERWEGDSLRPSSLVNYYMYYFRAGDWGRGRFPPLQQTRAHLLHTVEPR